jgi:phosphoribosylanthranilate isomerase
MIRVKICGITSRDDARAAVEAGADALGFVFVEGTPRWIEPEAAAAITAELPPFITAVGVFADRTTSEIERIAAVSGISVAQLHGDEPPEACVQLRIPFVKAIRIAREGDLAHLAAYKEARAFVLDAYDPARLGGTGRTFPWAIAREAARQHRIVLAGGLTPDNVAEAIAQVRPYAVDVSSGVETSPGRKDHRKLRAFIERARLAGGV